MGWVPNMDISLLVVLTVLLSSSILLTLAAHWLSSHGFVDSAAIVGSVSATLIGLVSARLTAKKSSLTTPSATSALPPSKPLSTPLQNVSPLETFGMPEGGKGGGKSAPS